MSECFGTRRKFIGLAAIAAAVLATGRNLHRPRRVSAAEPPMFEFRLGVGIEPPLEFPAVVFDGEPSALDLLREIAAAQSWQIQTAFFPSEGELVTGIAGIAQAAWSWFYWVNGRLADRAAASRRLDPGDSVSWFFAPVAALRLFERGDANNDGTVDISDPVTVLLDLFGGRAPATCPDAADADDDGSLNLTDAVFLLNYLFRNGPQIPAPNWQGLDLTRDRLSCR